MSEYDNLIERLNELWKKLSALDGKKDAESVVQRINLEREIEQVRRMAVQEKQKEQR